MVVASTTKAIRTITEFRLMNMTRFLIRWLGVVFQLRNFARDWPALLGFSTMKRRRSEQENGVNGGPASAFAVGAAANRVGGDP